MAQYSLRLVTVVNDSGKTSVNDAISSATGRKNEKDKISDSPYKDTKGKSFNISQTLITQDQFDSFKASIAGNKDIQYWLFRADDDVLLDSSDGVIGRKARDSIFTDLNITRDDSGKKTGG